jgi:hypothetical protein
LRRLPLRENADLDIPIRKEANAEYAKLTFSLGADLLDAAVNLGQRHLCGIRTGSAGRSATPVQRSWVS